MEKTPRNQTLEKQWMLEQVLRVAQESEYVFFAKFTGISSNDLNNLRRKLEKVADRALVVKNAIAKLVLERMNAKEATSLLEGSVLLATGKRDPQIVSKVLVEFAKEKENFELKGVFINKAVFKSNSSKNSRDFLPGRNYWLLWSEELKHPSPILYWVLGS